MPRVYVPNKGSHDFSKAERFGQLVYCTTGVLPKYSTSHMLRECQAAMIDSTKEDFILLTSLTTLCSLACSVFVRKHDLLNLLIFKDGDYVERKIVFN